MSLALVILLPALLGAEPSNAYKLIEDEAGMRVESRPVAGSAFEQFRLITATPKGVDILCESAFGDGSFDAREEHLLTRKILSESENERVLYEQRHAPVVSNRDFVIYAKRTLNAGKSCRVDFHLLNDKGHPVPSGYVRLKSLTGFWSFQSAPNGQTQVVYEVHTDLNGMVPAFLASNGMRESASKWVRLVIERAGEKKTVEKKSPGQAPSANAAHATE